MSPLNLHITNKHITNIDVESSDTFLSHPPLVWCCGAHPKQVKNKYDVEQRHHPMKRIVLFYTLSLADSQNKIQSFAIISFLLHFNFHPEKLKQVSNQDPRFRSRRSMSIVCVWISPRCIKESQPPPSLEVKGKVGRRHILSPHKHIETKQDKSSCCWWIGLPCPICLIKLMVEAHFSADRDRARGLNRILRIRFKTQFTSLSI